MINQQVNFEIVATKFVFKSESILKDTMKAYLCKRHSCSRRRVWVGYFIDFNFINCFLLFDVFNGYSLIQLKE